MTTTRRMSTTVLRLAFAAGLASGLAHVSPTLAQPAGDNPAVAVGEAALAQRTAKDIANLAIIDLQSSGSPAPSTFRMAALLLETAHQMSPRDQQILRLLIDAWSEAGERGKMLEYTGKLVDLMSELKQIDTVALLRLISGSILRLQDVDARLEQYNRFLGSQWEGKLDDSIRSRLALDAALLLREKGDTEGFVEKLTLATTLDSTNKDAASLAATMFSMYSDDAAGRLTLLINLLKADPFDPETHLAIGRELTADGAFAQAKRFFLNYQLLTTRLGVRPTPSEIAEYQTILWVLDGSEKLISQTRLQVEQERTRLAGQRRAMLTADPSATDLPDPEDYRLAIEVERVRAAAAAAQGDEAQIDYVAKELEGTVARRLALLQDAKKRPAEITDEIAQEQVKELSAELMWMRLWMGRNLDGAAATLEEIEKDPVANQASLARIHGWIRLRRGQLDGAAEILAPLAETDPLAAIGLGLVAEKRGDKNGAVEQYSKAYHAYPGTLAGAYARTRAQVLSGSAPTPPPVSEKINELAAGVPDWLEGMLAEPRRVFSIQASPVYPRIGPLDHAQVRLTITNLSPLALGIGPDRPIQSSMLLAPRLSAGFQPIGVGNASNIARVDRRLRLLPQESIQVDVWADSGILGFMLDQISVVPSEVRWTVLQGFSIDANGVYSPGPMNISTETTVLTRSATSKAGMDPAALVNFITSGTLDDAVEAMQVVRYLAQEPRDPNDEVSKKADEKIAQAYATRLPTLSQLGKLSLLGVMPTSALAPWLDPLVQAMRTDEDPLVRLFALIVTVKDAADPYLVTCAASPDARLTEVAQILKSRLEEGQDTYGRIGVPEEPEGQPNAAPAPVPAPLPIK